MRSINSSMNIEVILVNIEIWRKEKNVWMTASLFDYFSIFFLVALYQKNTFHTDK